MLVLQRHYFAPLSRTTSPSASPESPETGDFDTRTQARNSIEVATGLMARNPLGTSCR